MNQAETNIAQFKASEKAQATELADLAVVLGFVKQKQNVWYLYIIVPTNF
jgi:hypothetical protein